MTERLQIPWKVNGRWRGVRGPNKPEDVRFIQAVLQCTKQGDCWIWPKAISKSDGYGVFSGAGHKHIKAHRKSYTTFNGPIPTGKLICHTCDTRACINPSHLFPGTHLDNMRDKIAKGRGNYPRKLTDEQVVAIRASTRTNRDLAAEYGVHYITISQIRNGRKRSVATNSPRPHDRMVSK